MTKTTASLVILTDSAAKREWVLKRGIPQQLLDRFSRDRTVVWHARKPCGRHTDEHIHFVGSGEPARTTRGRSLRGVIKSLLRSSDAPDPSLRFDVRVCYEEAIQKLFEHARSQGVSHLALLVDDRVALLGEGVDLALDIAERAEADLVYSSQVDGILPIVVSVGLLERWLAADPAPDPRLLHAPERLRPFGKVVDVELVDPDAVPGQVRCYPLDSREHRLIEYWAQCAPTLAKALQARPDAAGSGRDQLEALLRDYREAMVPGLETYRVVGTLHDVEDLRSRMRVTRKPLVEYFVIATHYVRFLRRYAGLGADSHVVDIGCSWGYLGFTLANLLSPRGAYLGIEVQPQAVEWARERLGWLGENIRFAHLDIHNDFYNPAGSTSRDQVRLPVDDQWADVVVAGSVFTHMQEDGVLSYFGELRRILAPDGTAAFSFLDSLLWGSGEEYGVVNEDVPDEGTVFSRRRVEQLMERAGLEPVRDPVNMRQFDRTEYQTWYFARPKRS